MSTILFDPVDFTRVIPLVVPPQGEHFMQVRLLTEDGCKIHFIVNSENARQLAQQLHTACNTWETIE